MPLTSPPQKKKYTAEKFLSNFWCVRSNAALANSVNIQPIWNAWDIGQMITHSLKAAWKQGKTPCCRRFNGKIKSKEEKDEEEHNINKLKETLGEKKSIGIWTKKIDTNVGGRKWKTAAGLHGHLPTNQPTNQALSRKKSCFQLNWRFVFVLSVSMFITSTAYVTVTLSRAAKAFALKA